MLKSTNARPLPLTTLGIALLLLPLSSLLFGQEVAKEIPGWGRIVDPDADCKFSAKRKQVTITVPGTPHDLSAELDRMNAPRIIREIEGDFTLAVIVKGEFEPGEANIAGRTAYNGAGLLVMQDEKNYVRLERAVLVRGGQSRHYANFEISIDGQVQRIGTPGDMELEPEASCLLRIERVGEEVRGIVRQGTRAWTELVPKRAELSATLSVGVAAINASDKSFEARFSGFLLNNK
jgi:regulation of enolase protein 1 (concanavalin A-like superfamily)